MAMRPPCAECERLGFPNHPYLAHHGPGPCLVSISTAVKQTKAATGKVFMGSICPCQVYAPKP